MEQGRSSVVCLAVDLQDGFHGDLVSVCVNGEQIYHRAGVTTSPLSGLADSFKTDLDSGPATVEVAIETREISETVRLQVAADMYIGVSIVHSELEYIVSAEPFGYA